MQSMVYNRDAVVICNDKVRHLRYETLRKQLQQIPYWPHRYVHKVIGVNGEKFNASLKDFEKQFPKVKNAHTSLSRNGTYLSVTYEISAEDVDEIISLWVASESLEDCVKVL